MGANTRWKGTPWLAAIAAALLLGIVLFHLAGAESASRGEANAAAPSHAARSAGAPSRISGASSRGVDTPGVRGDDSEIEPTSAEDSAGEPDYPVDLDRLRQSMPNNLYWTMSAPSQDPQILEARAEEKRRWNDLLGKIQSGTGSDEEIHRYYDHFREVSEDYIEFASTVLAEYGEKLPERDRGLYELSVNMHRTRLAELPRRIDEALARKREQDQRRGQWRRNEGNP